MFKPILCLALISSLLFSSCGETKKEEEKKEETSSFRSSDEKKITPNMLADISITGMVSEVKCVGSMKKLLSAMVGVTEIEIDFSNSKNVNHAKVKFDNKIVNDKQMVKAIEKLNDGAYKVGNVDLRKIDEKSGKEVTFITPSGSAGFALPNILDVFNIL
jgi:copper chaperone CopZ